MTAMKEKVAARMAAHESMKKRWVLSAIRTEGKKTIMLLVGTILSE